MDERINLMVMLNALGLGGEERQALRLLPALDSRVFNVTLAYYDTRFTDLHDDCIRAGIRVLVLDRNAWGRLAYMRKAARVMRDNQVDILHAFAGTANFYGRLPALMAGVPVVLGGLRGQRGLQSSIRWAHLLANWRTDGWIVNAEPLATIVRKRLFMSSQRPIYLLLNGLEPKEEVDFRRHEETGYDRIRDRRFVIGAVGRLEEVKAFHVFLEAARRVVATRNDVAFWLLGDGPLRERYEAWIVRHDLGDHVRILGRRSDVDTALARMDILALSSLSEGCPNVLLEGLRAGLPLISTACTDLSRIIEEGINGHVVPIDHAGFMAERMLSILNADEDARTKMGRRSTELFDRYYTLHLAARRFENVYLHCLLKKRNNYPALNEKLHALGLDRDLEHMFKKVGECTLPAEEGVSCISGSTRMPAINTLFTDANKVI